MPDDWIRQWGDPTLRLVAREVERVDDILRRQVLRMQRRLAAAEGAGLAATQVGLLRRAFVFRLGPEHAIEALLNPRVVARSDERETFHEGCLSFNTITVAVERPRAVVVEGYDLDGNARTHEVEGFGASLLQHEIDHLDGILTLDRATPAERRRAIRALTLAAA
ncbi:MAG TPA: peptide deformylase [Solirubrobacteraceae bacterium]|nr:peptide deformylase [Solirubrobacteraceae bacterium]